MTYFSPCHAGCAEYKISNKNNQISYSQCTCIAEDLLNNTKLKINETNLEINAVSGMWISMIHDLMNLN